MRPRTLLVFALVPVAALLTPLSARAMQHSSLDDYRAHLEKLQTLVKSCESTPSACDPNAVGNDEEVQIEGLGAGANVNSFEAHYDWLRNTLKQAHDAKNKNRTNDLQTAQAKLDEASREVTGKGPAQADVSQARLRADAILGHPEFATARSNPLWEKLWAHVFRWLDRIFGGMARFGERSPWIGPVIEWGLIALALLALVVWAMRVLRRQRLAVRMEAGRQLEAWEETARDWRRLAEEQAARAEWRDAVHCLYWASIAVLEGRRLWSASRSRTPREYVRLLEAGSPRWKLLRQQTQWFEHVWYGLNEAAQRDYERALTLHEELRAA